MPRILTFLGATVAVFLVATGCSSPGERAQRNDAEETVHEVAEMISHHRHDTADGLARDALSSQSAEDGELHVLEAQELGGQDVGGGGDGTEPFARLVLRMHLDAIEQQGFTAAKPAVTVCVAVEFNRWEVVDSDTVDCPEDAEPYEPPPPPPSPDIPVGAEKVVAKALRTVPVARLEAHIDRSLTKLVDQHPTTAALPPTVAVATQDETAAADGGTIGVAVRGGVGECLFGVRRGDEVSVWLVPRVMAMPGELSCEPEGALAGHGTRSPH